MGLSPKLKLAAAITRIVGIDPSSSETNKRGLAPYFGSIIRGLVRREMTAEMRIVFEMRGTQPTIGVSNDGILWWAPEFVDTFRDDRLQDLAYILLHEAMHVALKHDERARALGIIPEPTAEFVAKSTMANLAMDACINEELEKVIQLYGDKPPTDWVTPTTLDQPKGLVFEERYRRLLQEVEKQQQANGGAGKSSKKVPPQPGKGWCGGCAGHPQPGEPQQGHTSDGRSKAEMDRFRREAANAVKEMASKGRGFVPDSLARWADELLAPAKIPWQEKLARVVRGAVAHRKGMVDLTWLRPSRKQGSVGYGVGRPVMPSFHAPVPRVAFATDTSGSMGEAELSAALSEVDGVLKATGAEITFLSCDAEVHGVTKIKSVKEAMKLLKGGGGTILEPAVKAMSELKPKPGIAIVATDGYCDDPPNYGLDLIFVVVGGNKTFKPTHGEVIYVGHDEVA